jgi:hypothetical protein
LEGGGGGPSGPVNGSVAFSNNFYFYRHTAKDFLIFIFCFTLPSTHPRGHTSMSFHSLPLVINEVRATEAVLNRIYDAAKLGLKGDNLALAAGMVPTAYRQLCELDRVAQLAEQKGRADGELLASKQLHKAAEEGDAKASLAILQNVHGWVAKQAITVDVNQQISILGALAEAERRAADVVDVIAHEPSSTTMPALQARLAPHKQSA